MFRCESKRTIHKSRITRIPTSRDTKRRSPQVLVPKWLSCISNAMQPSSTQPSKPRSEFYKPLHTMQIPGASGDTLSMSTPPRIPPGSVRKNQVAPAPEGTSTSLQKRPWDTIPFVVPSDHFTFTIFAAICWYVYSDQGLLRFLLVHYICQHLFYQGVSSNGSARLP